MSLPEACACAWQGRHATKPLRVTCAHGSSTPGSGAGHLVASRPGLPQHSEKASLSPAARWRRPMCRRQLCALQGVGSEPGHDESHLSVAAASAAAVLRGKLPLMAVVRMSCRHEVKEDAADSAVACREGATTRPCEHEDRSHTPSARYGGLCASRARVPCRPESAPDTSAAKATPNRSTQRP